jgi:hypothetical protein
MGEETKKPLRKLGVALLLLGLVANAAYTGYVHKQLSDTRLGVRWAWKEMDKRLNRAYATFLLLTKPEPPPEPTAPAGCSGKLAYWDTFGDLKCADAYYWDVTALRVHARGVRGSP